MVIGCVEVVLGEVGDAGLDIFIPLVCWSAAAVDATGQTKSEGGVIRVMKWIGWDGERISESTRPNIRGKLTFCSL
jgi:hypothetical protein